MNVLIIEDDELKLEQLMDYLQQEFRSLKISFPKSFQSGQKAILEGKDDLNLILLDMSMNTFDITAYETGGRRRSFAGKDILEQMKWNDINIPVIVVTQFETFEESTVSLSQLSQELIESFPDIYIGHVFFKPSLNKWKEDLKNLIFHERVAIASAKDTDN